MFVALHGHFYQPPRENPWTGLIPLQESAHPAHDWNQRITHECYRPNVRSRVMGPGNLIEEIVNNCAWISFDFGPTLLSWLEVNASAVYREILAADRISRRLQNGHGNAIAQVYNHVIMPLANERDKRTQVVWGLRDFALRFGRESESIWLPETAVNLETIRILIEHGLRYVILSPYQALRVRPLDRSRDWTDTRGGKIDPRRPYRFFLKDSRGRRIANRFMDVFFYDGAVAADVSFGHLLRSAPALAERLVEARGDPTGEQGLVSVATDGEVYGHHEPFGDMCLSYLVSREARPRGLRFVNYAHYLDRHPAEHEVDIYFGENGAGTAWSCAHGVGRWERDCGCSTGGEPGWSQAWRAPVRRGFDMVRDRLAEIYVEQAGQLVRDPWVARDSYVDVLLDPSATSRQTFLDHHAQGALGDDDRRRLMRLLESQRHAMFMYTSCGWFFADVSGVETVQNMAFAARAIELARPWQGADVEKKLLEYLAEAHSNIPEMSTGADVYRRFVNPQRISPQVVVGELALGAAVLDGRPEERLFRYDVVTHQFDAVEKPGNVTAGTGPLVERSFHGLLELADRDTEERWFFSVHIYHAEDAEIRCYVLPAAPDAVGLMGSAAPPDSEGVSPVAPSEEEVQRAESAQCFRLRDLVSEGRGRIIQAAYGSVLDKKEHLLAGLFDESHGLIRTLKEAGVPVPPGLRAMSQSVLVQRLAGLAEELEAAFLRKLGTAADSAVSAEGGATDSVASAESGPESDTEVQSLLDRVGSLLGFGHENEIDLPTAPLARAYGRVLETLLVRFHERPEPFLARRCVEVIESSYPLHFALDRRPLEDLAFQAFRKHRAALRESAGRAERGRDHDWEAFEALARALHLNIRRITEEDRSENDQLPSKEDE
jgi:alpha-amylase/alpha-mannosidase (GH57 family)